MKRIILVTEYFRPEPGGLEALFSGIARHWDRDAIEVIVPGRENQYLTTSAQRERFDKGESFPLHRVAMQSRKFGFGSQKHELETLVQERIESFQPDHVLIGDLRNSSRPCARVARQMGIPYSVFLNGNDLKNRLGFFQIPERRLALEATNIFTISRFLARGARGFGVPEDKIAVVPPGFESRWPRRIPRRLPEFLEKKVGKKILVLCLGPFMPRKGLDLAIKAMAGLGEQRDIVHLLLVGSGPEFPFLKELVRIHNLNDLVTMTGFIDDATLASILQRSDIFLQPGCEREDDVESLGTVFLEAAWFGIPVLGGRLGGMDEVVRHGVSGFVIEPGNLKDLTEKLEQLIMQDRLRHRLGKNARDIARRDFEMRRTCSAIDQRL